MNIKLFLESLNEDEKIELADLLKLDFEDSSKGKTTIIEFIHTNKISGRLRTTLVDYLRLYVNEYINNISFDDFISIRNSGRKTYNELLQLIIENNIPMNYKNSKVK